jgi:hypothetical protein
VFRELEANRELFDMIPSESIFRKHPSESISENIRISPKYSSLLLKLFRFRKHIQKTYSESFLIYSSLNSTQ